MAANHTTNYELNQWLSADQVLRTDFNADNAKLDVALAGKAEQTDLSEVQASIPRVAAGTYTGDGAASRTIHIGFPPRRRWSFTRWAVPTCWGAAPPRGTTAAWRWRAARCWAWRTFRWCPFRRTGFRSPIPMSAMCSPIKRAVSITT